jgi:hypothetical protein
MRFLHDLERVSDDNQEQIHHYGHWEEHPAEHEDWAEQRVKLNHFIESIRDFVAKHDTKQTEKWYEWLSESIGWPEHWQPKHAKTNEER